MSQMTPMSRSKQTKECSISKQLCLPNIDLVIEDIKRLVEISVEELN